MVNTPCHSRRLRDHLVFRAQLAECNQGAREPLPQMNDNHIFLLVKGLECPILLKTLLQAVSQQGCNW